MSIDFQEQMFLQMLSSLDFTIGIYQEHIRDLNSLLKPEVNSRINWTQAESPYNGDKSLIIFVDCVEAYLCIIALHSKWAGSEATEF